MVVLFIDFVRLNLDFILLLIKENEFNKFKSIVWFVEYRIYFFGCMIKKFYIFYLLWV